METAVRIILWLIAGYLALGMIAAAALHVRGLRRIDHAIIGAGFFFRVLITPGLVVLWPKMLRRWSMAGVEGATPPDPERTAAARRLRSIHGEWVRLLVVVVPVLAGLALYWRPAVTASSRQSMQLRITPDALPQILRREPNLFGIPGIETNLRGDTAGRRQLELVIDHDLEQPALTLYWIPPGLEEKLSNGVFLGAVWGPGIRRYAIPLQAAQGEGKFILYSLAHDEKVSKP